MGADVPDNEIETILEALGFSPQRVESGENAVWKCVQPSWRQDVTREVDLIEEVARHYGLDKFPARLHGSKQPSARLPHAEAEDRLRERLIGLGYHEIVSIPLVNAEEDALFRAGISPAVISNPLAADASLLRSTGLVSMAQALAWNINHGQRSVRLFEIGRAYSMSDGAPVERRIVTIGATGLAREKGITESAREYEFADLKGDLDQIGELAGGFTWREIERASWQQAAQAGTLTLATAGIHRHKTPEGGWWITTTGTGVMGEAGKLAPRIAERLKFRQDVFLAEFSLDKFFQDYEMAGEKRRYKPISRFPAVERDFALVLNDGTSFAAVRDAILSFGIAEIAFVEAVDLYRGKQMPPGTFSLLVRVTFQSGQATLTESQVSDFSTKILTALEAQLGATLRTS
jgi:phenylalanyl-tRNA synthetase beta chain